MRTTSVAVAAAVLLAGELGTSAERSDGTTRRIITLLERDAEVRRESPKYRKVPRYVDVLPHNSLGYNSYSRWEDFWQEDEDDPEALFSGGPKDLYWGNPKDSIAWLLPTDAAGEYHVLITYSCAPEAAGTAYDIQLADQRLGCRSQSTGSWFTYRHYNLGKIRLSAGAKTLIVQPRAEPEWKALGIQKIRLVPARIDPEPLTVIQPAPVHLVGNSHPGCMGWLAPYTVERNYCLGAYLGHLDCVASDENYNFALSEIPHVITMMEFEPERFEELRRRVKEGRVELVNAFVLEPTICLSGGEALVKQGVEGLRWYDQVLGVRPRYCWMVDIMGQHEQMGQIIEGLGLDALVYCRYNPTSSFIHWIESPDGTRAVAFGVSSYANWGQIFNGAEPLTDQQVRVLVQDARDRQGQTPAGTPLLILGGAGDYSQGPLKRYPSKLIEHWKRIAPQRPLHFSTPSQYADRVLGKIRSGEINLPVLRNGTKYAPTEGGAFWVENPKVKQWYRRSEHSVQAAETLATVASLTAGTEYPAQDMANAWMLMSLNMDRATLWGNGVAGVFEDEKSWDVKDRFETTEAITETTQEAALRALAGKGQATALFNPLAWQRQDAVEVTLPEGTSPAGLESQLLEDGQTTLVRVDLPSVGLASMKLEPKQEQPQEIALPETIRMDHYSARIDPDTGALISVRRKASGRDILAGPGNVIVALQMPCKMDRWMVAMCLAPRPDLKVLDCSSRVKPTITVTDGPLALVVTATSKFHGGGELRRVMRFFRHEQRIDFHTELNDIPDKTVVLAQFPLGEEITEVRRGIPFGFAHGAWSQPNPELLGLTEGIIPVIRWSHYQQAGGGGVALLDRGIPGRELDGNTAILYLADTAEEYYGYPTNWLTGKGRQGFDYALVWHQDDWRSARIPQKAWQFNAPPIALHGAAAGKAQSLLSTSDNVIVQAIRREGSAIEIRLGECQGLAGKAEVAVRLPHTQAALTDLLGKRPLKLDGHGTYRFSVRPQQIVTLRLQTEQAAPPVEALTTWDPIVPPAKRDYLRSFRNPEMAGHPPKKKE